MGGITEEKRERREGGREGGREREMGGGGGGGGGGQFSGPVGSCERSCLLKKCSTNDAVSFSVVSLMKDAV